MPAALLLLAVFAIAAWVAWGKRDAEDERAVELKGPNEVMTDITQAQAHEASEEDIFDRPMDPDEVAAFEAKAEASWRKTN